MNTEAIIGNIIQFFLYAGLFYIVLIWLKVTEKRLYRSAILAAILKLAELVGSLAIGILLAGSDNVGLFSVVFSTSLILIAFYLIVRNLLKLKAWQYIVIPLGVSLTGNIALAVIAMIYYKTMV